MLEFFRAIYPYIGFFFLLYLLGYATFLLLSVTVGSVSLYEQRAREDLYNKVEHDYYVPISIVVPAHNERVTIVDTVLSLLSLDYKLYEIVVVDDGSTDGMAQRLIQRFDMQRLHRPVRKQIPCTQEEFICYARVGGIALTLIRKENGGKADALNMGINASSFPYFICMDADSMLQYDSLQNIARPLLEENNVVACGGLIRIVNDVVLDKGHVVDYRLPKNLLLCMQVLEYDRSFLASRLLFDKFNGNLIISGAFGLFRKDLVVAVGGYERDTMGEDMELVVRLHAFCRSNHIDYRIRYAANAVCWSQAPATLKGLKTQRKRWHIGLFQSIKEHRGMLFNPKYGALSFVSFLYFLIYELLSPYIEVIGIITILLAAWANIINVWFMLLFMGLYILFAALMSVTAFFSRIHAMRIKLRARDVWKVILLCTIENAGLRLILAFTRFTAFFGYKKKKREWGKIQRTKIKHRQSADEENRYE